MVLAERNSTELVRNGRRSRGPSPSNNNGHGASSGSGAPVTPETSSDDDNSIKRNGKKNKQSEYEEKIRVGRDYQATCPPLIPEPERKPEIMNDRALLVWSPTKEIPDIKLEEYISVAKEKYGYNGEQALGMLFWHKHDLERAVMDLANFTPFPDEWSMEDKVLFDQAFQFHGKSFHRIRQMLPDKSIASLVKYYYSWKKTRHRQSVMDRQEKAKAASKEGSENGSENGSNESSEEDKDQALASTSGLQEPTNSNANTTTTKLNSGAGAAAAAAVGSDALSAKQIKTIDSAAAIADANDSESTASAATGGIIKQQQQQHARQQTPPNSNTDSSCTGGRASPSNGIACGGTAGCCSNCGVPCHVLLNASPHGKLCSSCHHHWRRTGNKRPTSGPFFGKRTRDRNAERHKRKPPRGMYINHDDIVALASANDNQDELLANTDREIVSLLSQVQLNKQNISSLKRKNSDSLEEIRPADTGNRINSRWTNDELMMAVQGVRKYGKDFQTIAETIGTKTEAHVRTFYMNNRRRYNLDQVLKKHEAEKAIAAGNTTGATAAAASEPAGNKKDEPKKKESTAAAAAAAAATTATSVTAATIAEESDNTTSSETTASKSTNDEAKSLSSNSNSSSQIANAQKDNIIMEIDLDAEQSDAAPPAAKKIALSVANQDLPKASVV